MNDVWRNPAFEDLCDAFLELRTREEAAAFLRDICSLHELEALGHRWQAARMLDRGTSYARVAAELHASTATVTRVAHWLNHGDGGSRLPLVRIRRAGRARA